MIQQKIFLASKSPRRAQLLQESGIPFEQISIDVDEIYPKHLANHQVAEYLARLKATAALKQHPNKRPILTADSIVLLKDEILEKPKDLSEARKMLLKLSDEKHFVDTGFCIVGKHDEMQSYSVRSSVKMATLIEDEINYYIQHYQPFDKAGSYGIQEWMGHCKIERIEGSYTNIMGLPMFELYNALRQMVR